MPLRPPSITRPITPPVTAQELGADIDFPTHLVDIAPHGATAENVANRLILRDSAGRAQVADPVNPSDIVTKNYLDKSNEGLVPFRSPRLPGASYYVIPGWAVASFGGSTSLVAGRIYYIPIFVARQRTYDRIAIMVSTAATGTCRLGIFAWNENDQPGSLVLDAGEVDTSTTGTKEIAINVTLSPGWYWLAARPTANVSVQCIYSFSNCSPPISGISSATVIAANGVGYVDAVWSDPAPAPIGFVNLVNAFVLLREVG